MRRPDRFADPGLRASRDEADWRRFVKTAGIAIVCKTPEAGQSKTRLSPPLTHAQCAALSECFIRDLAANIRSLCEARGFSGYAVYTPVGSEATLRRLLPGGFGLIPQCEGDLGARLLRATEDVLARGHDAAILLNADSPTLPMALLEAAADRLFENDCAALGPAVDGGYTFIGLTRAHPRLFEDMPWSTDRVHRLTQARAAAIALPVFNTAPWYDVDDASSLTLLEAELGGQRPAFAAEGHRPEAAPATAAMLKALGLERG